MQPHDLDLLLANAGWVRALARELAGPGGADDLVQETWLAALRRTGAERNPAAWLAGVVRHLARRARRSETSRPRREAAAARPEAQPATDELVAEGELQRRLIEAVMRLEEPYRSTVLLRYFRGASCEGIATAQGVPAATVRTRLARARARLREMLDRSCGGREAWGALVLALPRPPGATILAEVLVMGVKTKLAVTALACAAVAWFLWPATEEGLVAVADATTPESGLQPGPAPRPAPAALAEPAEVAPGETAPPPRVPVVQETAEVPGTLAYGTFGTARGEDVEDGWLTLEDEAGVRLGGPMREPGTWSIDGLHAGRWRLRAGASGCSPLEDELVVASGQRTAHHDVALDRGLVIRIRVLDEFGRELVPGRPPLIRLVASKEPLLRGALLLGSAPDPLGAGTFQFASHSVAQPDALLVLQRTISTGAGALEVEGASPPDCFARLRPTEPLPIFVHALARDEVLATEVVAEPVEELVLHVDTGALERRLGGLRARFVDARSGAPLAGAAQLLDHPTVGVFKGASTPLDPLGAILFERRQPGVYWLVFQSDTHVRPPFAVRVPAAALADLGDVRAWPATTLRGEVVDEHGDPASVDLRWTPLAEAGDPLGAAANEWLHVGGRFELGGVPCTPLWLTLSTRGSLSGLAVDPGADGWIVIRTQPGTRVTFLHGAEGDGRFLTVADGDGRALATWTLGTRASASLAPGRYQLWAGADGRVDARAQFALGGEPLELQVPGPGH